MISSYPPPPRACFYDKDELIRQVTINCAERGLLLLRVRDEIHMTIAAYQTMYESSIAFGMRKALIAEQRKAEMEAKVCLSASLFVCSYFSEGSCLFLAMKGTNGQRCFRSRRLIEERQARPTRLFSPIQCTLLPKELLRNETDPLPPAAAAFVPSAPHRNC